jgi:hypothetical protein
LNEHHQRPDEIRPQVACVVSRRFSGRLRLTIVNFETGRLTPDRAINGEIQLTLESAGIEFATGEPGTKFKGLK